MRAGLVVLLASLASTPALAQTETPEQFLRPQSGHDELFGSHKQLASSPGATPLLGMRLGDRLARRLGTPLGGTGAVPFQPSRKALQANNRSGNDDDADAGGVNHDDLQGPR